MTNIIPYTIWDELAESDILIEYMRIINNDTTNIDNELSDTLFYALYNYSNETIPEVEEYFMKKYSAALENFLDKTKNISGDC